MSGLSEFARGRKVSLYLVGGAVRDILLKRVRENPDFDFCVPRGAVAFAKAFAGHAGAGFVVLDDVHQCARVVLKEAGRTCTFDFSDFRGATLDADLRLRDFTVNSIAAPLDGVLTAAKPGSVLIDPLGGAGDIRRRRIVMAHPKAFDDDPLRILRVFSFACMCGFSIERKTRSALKKRLKLLSGVSAERIRDELFRLLSSPAPAAYLSLMASDGVIGRLFPEMVPVLSFRKRGMFVWRHTLGTIDALDALIRSASRRERERGYFLREISSGRSYAALLKLAAMLHDISKPVTYRYADGKVSFYGHERRGARESAEICQRLKLSNDEVRRVKSAVFLHLRPGYMVTGSALTKRAVFRFMRDAGDDSGGILMLALADERATSGYAVVDKCRGRYERVMRDLLGRFFNAREEVKRPKLFDGHMIMKHCRLPAGPLIGSIMRELEEAQAVGEISTREQALERALTISRRPGEEAECRK